MPRLPILSFLLPVLALITSANAVIKQIAPHPADPFADPAHDVYNPLRYIASNVLTTIGFVLVLIVAILQTACIFKWGAKWMLSMTIGAYCFATGLALRFPLHSHPEAKGTYIAEYLFVVLSPCAFIAADYVLLGRLSRHLGGDRYLLISSRRITLVFVSSDISTFLIQAIGGSMSISANDTTKALAGSRVFLAGLAAQLLSFGTFTVIFLLFVFRIRKYEPETWRMDVAKPWYSRWTTLAFILFVSCIGILIRSGYRVVELSEGFGGRLTRSEPLFYGLDTLPLFVAVAVYVPFWPGRFINDANRKVESSPHSSVAEPVEKHAQA